MADEQSSGKWTKGSLLLMLGEFLRAWLPSIILHLVVLLCLTFVTIGSGVFGDQDGEESTVNIVIRETSATEEVEYLNKQEFQAQSPEAPALQPADNPSEELQLEQIQQPRAQQQLESIIGPGSEDSGGAIGGGGGGGGGQMSFFGLTAKGKRVVYIVDRSGSMDGQRILAAKAELMRSIKNLPRGARYNVYFFSSGPVQFEESSANKLMRSSRGRNQKTFEWIRHVRVEGGTQPLPALLTALSLEPDVIFFLTDGEFDEEVVPETTAANKNKKVQIHCVGFDRSGRELLEALAKQNGGRYRHVSPSRYRHEEP